MISCPLCGSRYVGTSAVSKQRKYRYYTCYTSARYGTATCPAARISVDLLDRAVIEILINFYGDTEMINEAIRGEHALRVAASIPNDAEATILDTKIKGAQSKIDRYLDAFEQKTLDDQTCGARIRNLRSDLARMEARRAELADRTTEASPLPTPDSIAQLRHDLALVVAHSTPGQGKALEDVQTGKNPSRWTSTRSAPGPRVSAGPSCHARARFLTVITARQQPPLPDADLPDGRLPALIRLTRNEIRHLFVQLTGRIQHLVTGRRNPVATGQWSR